MTLSWLGQTINVMTLGGLALSVGILVDDATVMIENISSHLDEGEELEPAIISAANQIVVPTFVSTVCICIVWLPLFSLSGVGGYLFKPLAMSIVFAMIASFILSRTLVPTMAVWLLGGQVKAKDKGDAHEKQTGGSVFTRFQRGFDHGFEHFRNGYHGLLQEVIAVPGRFILVFLGLSLASLLLLPLLGRNFFPEVRSGEMDMHMRAQIGTRIEDAGKLAVLVGEEIRKTLPGKVDGIVDNCGLPTSGIDEVYNASGTIGPEDCDITISLTDDAAPVERYRETLRARLPSMFPGTAFTFLPGDITAKILDFGLPAPIDIQITGRDQQANFDYAKAVLARVAKIPGVADANILQALNAPTLLVTASRSFASGTGLTEADVANDALNTLSGSGQTAPNYWLDTSNGVSYLVNLQTPQTQLDSINALETVPVDAGTGDPSGHSFELLGALSRITQTGVPLVVSHYSITPTIDIYVSLQRRDLGAIGDAVQRVVDETAKDVPKSAEVAIRGQGVTMVTAYDQLIGGLAFAVALVYLALVVNFQSWADPFIIITALPGALAGIVWSLFITQTTLSVPALTGAIMCMGTATANSILVVSFARERFKEHGDAARAAAEAGFARVRPVLMTALAMIIGMLPMSLSNTQNAPLGRAVMGGLLVATIFTLLFVPAVFTMIHGRLLHKANHGAAKS
jgi:multidrug efflux pump subunit AcrB